MRANASAKPLEAALILPGVLFMAAAITGGAAKAFGIDLPAISSTARQLELFGLGIALAIAGTASRWGPVLRDLVHRPTPPLPPIPPGTARPPDPSDHFVGRAFELNQLPKLLSTGNHRVAISGLGGIGKSQLAVHYIHGHSSLYPNGTFWLHGEGPAVLSSELVKVAAVLGLPEQRERDQELVIQAVMRWLLEHEAWLVVIDNLDEKALTVLENHLPPGLQGHILATTRHPIWGNRLPLGPLPLDVATDLILQRTGQSESNAAEQIALHLGRLPLALEQAVAYLRETGESLPGYLQLLEESPSVILAEGQLENGLEPVVTTWNLNFRQVETTSSAAAELLRLCAYFASDDIPLGLIEEAGSELEPGATLRATLSSRLRLNDVVSVLLRYSLVERRGESLSVHRLVQEVVRNALPVAQAMRWSAIAARVVEAVFPHGGQFSNWEVCQRLLPHALVAVQRALELGAEPAAAGRLLNDVGAYLQARGAFSTARPLLELAVAVQERVLGPDHPGTASSMNNLGLLLKEQGELEAAQPYLERALTIEETTRGADHPETASALNNLGALLLARGDLNAAQPYLERALAIREKVLGPDHPLTAVTLNNLGSLFGEQGRLDAARAVLERALAIREKVLAPDDPDTALSLTNLGLLLKNQGDLEAARVDYERALAIQEKVLGPDHSDTAWSLNNLGALLDEQGNSEAARRHFERALAIQEKTLGPDHPTTARTLNNLGMLLHSNGEVEAGLAHLARAVAIQEKALGLDHLDTASSSDNLGSLLYQQGDLEAARPHLERALAIRERLLPADHPDVAASLNKLGTLFNNQHELSAARPLLERGLAIRERVLEPDDLATAASLYNLGALLYNQNQSKAARRYIRRALAIQEKVLGPDHPEAIASRRLLTTLSSRLRQ